MMVETHTKRWEREAPTNQVEKKNLGLLFPVQSLSVGLSYLHVDIISSLALTFFLSFTSGSQSGYPIIIIFF